MDFSLTTEQQQLLVNFRSYLDGLDLAAVHRERDDDPHDIRQAGRAFLSQLGSDGWLAVGWPQEYGGRGLSAIDQWLILEELAYRHLPDNRVSLLSIGPALIRVGTEDQKRTYLAGILKGEIRFALGYSEPNAGSDLASLRTRAIMDRGEYIISGQKIYTSGAHNATHIWLAVRTDDSAPKHQGISLLIVPINSTGITIRPLNTQGDTRTNEVFFDDVRVPRGNLVGRENEGWQIVTVALDFERIFAFSKEASWLDDLVDWAAVEGPDGSTQLSNEFVAQTLAQLVVDVEIARLFALRIVWLIHQGKIPSVEASICKIWVSELGQRIPSVGLGLLGENGQLAIGTGDAPIGGKLERAYRGSPMFKFAGGTNEVQRNIIAQRGLGLPR